MPGKSYSDPIVLSVFAAAGVTFCLGVSAYIPFIGSALTYLANPVLLQGGSGMLSLQALGAFGSYAVAFLVHNLIDRARGLQDAPIGHSHASMFSNVMITVAAVGAIFKFSKNVKYIATALALLTGYAEVAIAVQLLWILGVPALCGYLHYQEAKKSAHQASVTFLDSAYFALALAGAALMGWYWEWKTEWTKVNPFSRESSAGWLLDKMSSSAFSGYPNVTVEKVAGECFTKVTALYFAFQSVPSVLDSSQDRKSVKANPMGNHEPRLEV